MFCSSCGTAVAQGLNYCKHCGAKLSAAKDEGLTKPPEGESETLVAAIVVVFIVGLGAIIGLMVVMKRILDFQPELILAITLLSFLLMFIIEGAFFWLLLNRKRVAKEVEDISRLKEQLMKELGETHMPGAQDPPLSISEHTTQTLEPVYSEPKSK